MLHLDIDQAMEMFDEYYNEPPEGHDKKILGTFEYLYNTFIEEIGDTKKDLYNKLSIIFPGTRLYEIELEEKIKIERALKKIPKDEVAFYASNLAFMFGLVYAEKLRLNLKDN